MKYIFMLLILFVLTDPVLAKPINTSTECLHMYRDYIDEYGAGKFIPETQMLNFIGHCLPDDSTNKTTTEPTYIDGSQRQKLFHNDRKNTIVGIKM